MNYRSVGDFLENPDMDPTSIKYGTGWKSVDCSTRHTTLCVTGKNYHYKR